MIKILDCAKYYKGTKNQVDALNKLDSFLENSPLISDDCEWVRLWRTSETLQINNEGLDLIEEFEGCVLSAYDDGVGVLTIGYGHTKDVYPNQVITEAQAIALLNQDLLEFENGVKELVKVALNDNQFSALVSFAFNVGLGAFESSTLLRLLNTGDMELAAAQFMQWINGGGQVLVGLKRRRQAEMELFLR